MKLYLGMKFVEFRMCELWVSCGAVDICARFHLGLLRAAWAHRILSSGLKETETTWPHGIPGSVVP